MAQTRSNYELGEIKDVIDVLDALYNAKGIDLQCFMKEAVQGGMKSLTGFGAKQAFNTLSKANCSESSLAFLLYLIRSGPRWSNMYRLLAGSQRRRSQIGALLARAAATLEQIDQTFEKTVSREKNELLSPSRKMHVGETHRLELVVSPATCARSLRAYVRVLNVFESASREAKIHSPEAFGKYLLSAYVRATTGDYHDVEVSALISGALREQYSEVAHRMWRQRNWKNLEKVSFPVEFQVFLGLLLATQA